MAGVLNNPNFNLGATGWQLTTAASIENLPGFNGAWIGQIAHPGSGDAVQTHTIANTATAPVTPGQSVTVAGYMRGFQFDFNIQFGGPFALPSIGIRFRNASEDVIQETFGAFSAATSVAWRRGEHTAIAPAGAVDTQLVFRGIVNTGSNTLSFDAATWNAVSTTEPSEFLAFRAIQASGAFSGGSEPTWPGTVGGTVVDGGVTWEAFIANRVQWTAFPLLRSGATEPDWPTTPGASVVDGTIAWEAINGQVRDPRCPNTKAVAIASSKVFAVDDDIIRFSATVNPLDWSSQDDAGFLPFGLQTYGSNPAAALGLYRGNLVVFNSQGFQMWQVDEDPVNMALLDAVPVGTTYQACLQPMSNELFLLTDLGVRTIGIAGASTNLQADDVGKPIDTLVQEALRENEEPFALFYPAAGQYWLVFGNEAFVLTINGTSRSDRSWTRYIFPFPIEDWTLQENDLYLKSGRRILRVDRDALADNITGDGGVTTFGFSFSLDGDEGSGDFLEIDGWAFVGQGLPSTILQADLIVTDDPENSMFVSSGRVTVRRDNQARFTLSSIRIRQQDSFAPQEPATLYLYNTPTPNFSFSTPFQVIELPLGDSLTPQSISQDAPCRAFIINGPPRDSTPPGQRPQEPYYLVTMAGTIEEEVVGEVEEPFTGVVQWHWLDMGEPSRMKMMLAFDLVGAGEVSVSFGFDQTDRTAFTSPYTVDADTLPQEPIPLPVSAPSFSMRLEFSPFQDWEWNASTLYFDDRTRMKR